MIQNTNIVVLADSNLELVDTIIVANAFSGENNKLESSSVTLQINFYTDTEKFLQRIALNVSGFEKTKRRLTFDYPVTDTDVFLYFDTKIKEYIMSLFPTWDETKLVLTTEEEII